MSLLRNRHGGDDGGRGDNDHEHDGDRHGRGHDH